MRRILGQICAAAAVFLLASFLPASASPWAEVGDGQLRADLETLQAAGVVHALTIAWPMPWASLLQDLDGADLARQPRAVRVAAERLRTKAMAQSAPGYSAALYADFTNRPSVVYGFDGMGRGDGQAQLSLSRDGDVFSGRIALGAITNRFGGKPNKLMADGTYFSLRVGDVRLYAGYLDHWWGPGEISTLQLSNNARPMPQIGISRASTTRSSWPVVDWLGPWQFEFFLSKMDGPQVQSNVYYSAAHVTFSPFEGLELGAAKTEQFCGQGHPCSPLRDYFVNVDLSNHPDNTNGEGSVEIKYSGTLGRVGYQLYGQLMNEDYSWLTSSGSSYLAGIGLFVPMAGNPLKLTLEYTDTIATKTPFSFGNHIYGYTYYNGQYPDGMHYRGRTLGFSLDTDATLLSLQGSWTDPGGRFYQLSLHHASIGSGRGPGTNTVSAVPMRLNLAEAKFVLPLRHFNVELAGRIQDDQPRPGQGFVGAVEVALRAPL